MKWKNRHARAQTSMPVFLFLLYVALTIIRNTFFLVVSSISQATLLSFFMIEKMKMAATMQMTMRVPHTM